jgi:hypothetical protein
MVFSVSSIMASNYRAGPARDTDPLIALADRDPTAEPAHRLRQLECTVAASQDRQMLRHDIKIQ